MKYDYNKASIMAFKRCEGHSDNNTQFSLLYPFTTENIAGYIDKFNLKDKSLLTVGSSGDQIINAVLNGCKDITLLDVNPYAKFYYYLKASCILCLDRSEYLKFLVSPFFGQNGDSPVFDKNIFNKIKSTLRLLDYDSYLFWDELFLLFDVPVIRRNMFSSDQDNQDVIVRLNKYLLNDNLYEETRKMIKSIRPHFINSDLFEINIYKIFDNIWLSNIACYLNKYDIKQMFDIMNKNLKNDGKLLLSYMYDAKDKQKSANSSVLYGDIYNLKLMKTMLENYEYQYEYFIGVYGIHRHDNKRKDGVLIYTKKY